MRTECLKSRQLIYITNIESLLDLSEALSMEHELTMYFQNELSEFEAYRYSRGEYYR